jgi:hypothetical protein
MDPNATWRRLVEAETGDDAREAAMDLIHWLACGGFPPDALKPLSAGAVPLFLRCVVWSGDHA